MTLRAHSRSRVALAGLAAAVVALALAGSAHATDGTWERAWGQNVNGGGVFGICTMAASCAGPPGNNGGLGGEMYSPFGVATDAAGNVYVADNTNRRIQKFASDGTWKLAWGMNVIQEGKPGDTPIDDNEICTVRLDCQAAILGGSGGDFGQTYGVATDAAGFVYVADAQNNRIQKFDSSATFQRAWGRDVVQTGHTGNVDTTSFEICGSPQDCKPGTTGGLGGMMNNPEGVATDAAGNVYVSDTQNNRIQKFDSSGNFLLSWGRDVVFSGQHQTGSGFEICMNAANSSPTDVCQPAAPSTGLGGDLFSPQGIATDAAGNVYVAEVGNSRISKFDSSGNFLRAWGKDVVLSGEHETLSDGFEICMNAANSSPDDVCKAGDAPGTGKGGELYGPTGITTDPAGSVYVADVPRNRIEKFDSSGNWLRAWGDNVNSGGVFGICTVAAACLSGDNTSYLGGEMGGPAGVAADAAGALYVGDSQNNRVQKFKADPAPPSGGGGSAAAATPAAAGPTGLRAAALKKCKKKHGRARANCKKKANKLPL